MNFDFVGQVKDFLSPDTFKVERVDEEEFGFEDDDKAKTKSSDKQEKKDSTETGENTVVKEIITELSESVLKHPKVPNSDNVIPADYYRKGKFGQINQGDPELSVKYDVLPRTIDEIPEDAEASIRLIGKLSKGSKSKDHDLIPPYTKIFITSVQEGHTERSQIIETFGRFYVFFFGERPPVYTFSGSLINANNVNWAQDFQFYYSNYLRGTKCVEFNARSVITYGYDQIEGFIMGMSSNKVANDPNKVDVSFQVLVIDRKVLKLSMDFGLINMDGSFSADANLLTMLKKGTSKPYPSKANKELKEVVMGETNPSKAEVPKSIDYEDTVGEFGNDIKKQGGELISTYSGKIDFNPPDFKSFL